MKVPLTDEWKLWSIGVSTRSELPSIDINMIPILDMETLKWKVTHPRSTIYMLVDHADFTDHCKKSFGEFLKTVI